MPQAFPKRAFDPGALLRRVAARPRGTSLLELLGPCTSFPEQLVALLDGCTPERLGGLLLTPEELEGLDREQRASLLTLLRFLQSEGLLPGEGAAPASSAELVPEEARPALRELALLMRAVQRDGRPDRLIWADVAWRVVEDGASWAGVMPDVIPRLSKGGGRFGSDPDVELRLQTAAAWSLDTLPSAMRQEVTDLRDAFSATSLQILAPLWFLLVFVGTTAREGLSVLHGAGASDDGHLIDLGEQLRALSTDIMTGWELRIGGDPRVQHTWRTTKRFLLRELGPPDGTDDRR